MHLRKQPDPADRTILRINFDTIYSFLLDLTALAIELPLHAQEIGRYQSVEVLNDQHYISFVFTNLGRYELTQEGVGSRFAIVIFRTQVNIQDPSDLSKVAALQDQTKVEQEYKEGPYMQFLQLGYGFWRCEKSTSNVLSRKELNLKIWRATKVRSVSICTTLGRQSVGVA